MLGQNTGLSVVVKWLKRLTKQTHSNGLKLNPFSGDSSFRVFTVMKVHFQTLMAMKSGCKIYTHTNVTQHLNGPLCYISNIGYVAHNLCNVPSENNSARESALKM